MCGNKNNNNRNYKNIDNSNNDNNSNNYVKLEMEKCNMACVSKPRKTKMLKSQEHCNCHELLF